MRATTSSTGSPTIAVGYRTYRSARRSNRVRYGPRWDRLRPELNWKPYWGENADAKIIHFHGPKPFQRDYIESHWPELKSLTGGAYLSEVKRWTELLEEAR